MDGKAVGKCSLCGGIVYEDFHNRKTCINCYAVEKVELPTISMESVNESQKQFLTES